MPASEQDLPCPGCGREPGRGRFLIGWMPCACRGHRTHHCDRGTGGCGTWRYTPPLGPDCSEVVNAPLPNPYIRRP